MKIAHWVADGPGDLDVLRLEDGELTSPGPGEVTIEVRAAGVNPADWKHLANARPGDVTPVGYEVSGVVAALGPDTALASGGGAIGDEVVAFRVRGGYATALTVPARDVFAKPAGLEHEVAANLLLAGSTAAEMLHVTGVAAGDTIVVHGASGAVGVSVLQQARLLGAYVVGTASESSFEVVRRFGGVPVAYGPGLLDRLRALAPEAGYAASLDTVGTDEAVDAGLALVPHHDRLVTIAAPARAERDQFRAIGGSKPDSAAFRDGIRGTLIELAGRGDLVVPMARTFRLDQAVEALRFLQQGHPGGKLALLP